MKSLFRCLFRAAPARPATRTERRLRPEVESLEERRVMTVTPHGGAVLPHVEVEALYYGSNWSSNPTLFNQTGQFEGFLQTVVNSSYMDMLANAGYGVGRGSWSGGKIYMATPGSTITDGDIRSAIQNAIWSGNPLAAPDANRLYVLYVEPNVEVIAGFNSTRHAGLANSVQDFAGYHTAFLGFDASGFLHTIRYAVVTTPGGTVGNAKNNNIASNFDEMTEASSHEISEAVTDPDIGYSTLGWNDDSQGEIGDLANGQVVYLNGYAVQREGDQNDQPMTPAGARAVNPVSFVLKTDGTLYMHGSSGLTFLSSGIASVSDQGIDNNGHAMVGVTTTGGLGYEYHEGGGWLYLTNNVKMTKAGQGVTYVLRNDGTVWEYKDATGWAGQQDSGVTAIDAGTDRYGVNMFTEVWYGSAYEHSDSTGWHYIGSGVKAVSAGQFGIVAFVGTNGNGYYWVEASGSTTLVGYTVAQISAGTDENGNLMLDELYTNGTLYEWRASTGWTTVYSGYVTAIGKGRAGVIDMVFSWGDAWDHSSGGWTYLTGSAQWAA